MGLDISVYKLIKLNDKNESSYDFFRMTDQNGNRIKDFPEWTRELETDYEQEYYDWDKYREQTGIDVMKLHWKMESYEENGTYYECFTKWDLGLVKQTVKVPGAILKDRNGNKLR